MRLPLRLAPRLVLFVVALASSTASFGQTLDRGFNPGADAAVRAMALQRDGGVILGGSFAALGGSGTGFPTTPRRALARVHANGAVDTGFDPGANGLVSAIALQADGKAVVGGSFTTIGGGGTGTTSRQRIARLLEDGSVDATFDPGANGSVTALAVQPDGRILVGGSFFTIGGGDSGAGDRRALARLNADGSLDTTFVPGARGSIEAIVLQSDGRILIGGLFSIGTEPHVRVNLARLHGDGTVDLSFATLVSDVVTTIAVQPDRKVLVGGRFTWIRQIGTTSQTRYYLARLHPDGSVDGTFNPGADWWVDDIDVQANGQIIVAGSFRNLASSPRLYIARLNSDGSLDVSFDTSATAFVYETLIQPDGRILLGGTFSGINSISCPRICRIDADGSYERDLGFLPNGPVYAIAIQPDTRMVVAGNFTRMGAALRQSIARIGTSTYRDETFNPGADGEVRTLALQEDGRVLVGGFFTALGNGGTLPRKYIGRLEPSGALDTSFNPAPNHYVHAIVVQRDGKILVGGDFSSIAGAERRALVRLNADGSIDPTFRARVNGSVYSIAVQPDGKILVGGIIVQLGDDTIGLVDQREFGRFNADGSFDASFRPITSGTVRALAVQPDGRTLVAASTSVGGMFRRGLHRLHADGSIDGTFDPGLNGSVHSIVLERDGKILLGGGFTRVGGGGTGTIERHNLARLLPDGAVDTTFNPGANAAVNAVAIQADGRIVIGGNFTFAGGGGTGTASASRLTRFGNLTVVNQQLTSRFGTSVVWTRSGGQQFERVTFESSDDGISFSPLGTATATASGWELHGLSLRSDAVVHLRARGYAIGGYGSVSNGIVQVTAASSSRAKQPFAEDPLLTGHVIRASHVTELRQRIDAVRVRAGLLPFVWSDASLGSGGSIRAAHVNELRMAVQEACNATGRLLPTFSDPVVMPGVTIVRVAHVRELREAVLELESY